MLFRSGRFFCLAVIFAMLFLTGCGGGGSSSVVPVVPTTGPTVVPTPTTGPTGPTGPTGVTPVPTVVIPTDKHRVIIDLGARGTGLANAYFAYTAIGDQYVNHTEIVTGDPALHEYAQNLTFNEVGGAITDNKISFDVDSANTRINIFIEQGLSAAEAKSLEGSALPYNGKNYLSLESIDVNGGEYTEICLDNYVLCTFKAYMPKASWDPSQIPNGFLYIVDTDGVNDRKIGNYSNKFENEWYTFSFMNDQTSSAITFCTINTTGAQTQSVTDLALGLDFDVSYTVGCQLVNAIDKKTFDLPKNLISPEAGVFEFAEDPGNAGYAKVSVNTYAGDRLFYLTPDFTVGVNAVFMVEYPLIFNEIGSTTLVICDLFEKTGEKKIARIELPGDKPGMTTGKQTIGFPVPLKTGVTYFSKITLITGVKTVETGGVRVQETGFWTLNAR